MSQTGKSKEAPWNICGVVVRARPGEADAVAGRLAALPGLELHGDAPDGRMIVTIEDTEQSAASDTLTRLFSVEGVLGASLVYHHNEPTGSRQESRQ